MKGMIIMLPFIRNDQYNFIQQQTQTLINAYASANDNSVLEAVKSLAIEKVIDLFDTLDKNQIKLLEPIVHVKDRESAEQYLLQVKQCVVPFQTVTDQKLKKLFPKAKKLKLPKLQEDEWKEICYLGWDDPGTNKRFLIIEKNGKCIGIEGAFKRSNQTGMCTLCNHFEEVGMFTSKKKGEIQGTFVERGNYICKDMQQCNRNISSLDKLESFVNHLK